MVVVLDRWMTRDWRRLLAMLERREVYTRFADMVHCRPGSLWSSSGSTAARFGVHNLPAIVIVETDGTAHALELPATYESIIRFADGVRLGETPADAEASAAVDSAAVAGASSDIAPTAATISD